MENSKSTLVYEVFEGIQNECLIILTEWIPPAHLAAVYYERHSRKNRVVNYKQFLDEQLTTEIINIKMVNSISLLNSYLFYWANHCHVHTLTFNESIEVDKSTLHYYAELALKKRPQYFFFQIPDGWLPNNNLEV